MTLRIYLRQRPDSRGECTIYFIVNDEWMSTGIKTHPDHWDAGESIIKKTHPRLLQVQSKYSLYKCRAEICILNLNFKSSPFNKKYFETFVFEDPDEADNPSFLKLIDDYCSNTKLCDIRIKNYKILKKNVQHLVTAARIKDINYDFAIRLRQYLRTINNENTVSTKMKMLKAVVHHAQKNDIIPNDPLINVKIKNIIGNKNHLTAAELEVLEKHYREGALKPIQRNVLRYFLFSCYTGLRYSDVIRLKYYDIKDGCVFTTQQKTDKPVMVPLISKAKDLLQIGTTGACFRTHANQVSNRTLKDIMKAAGIEKKITYHCSRHTFGTLSIYWGIPKEVVAELMGVDFETVEIYAKIVDDVKKREMLKWEQAV